ncbi:hypothetical protein JW921_07675 [Candidatus Fermentibacterales bacterium]|nr:hypothetical protein [Candidatus Fermentibacterales bacterium]
MSNEKTDRHSHAAVARAATIVVPLAILLLFLPGRACAHGVPLVDRSVHDITIPPPDRVGPDVYWPVPGSPTSPPPDPEVGDSWLWWLWIHYPMPPHFEQHMCTVRGKSDRGYVIVRDEEWLVSIDQEDVDAILDAWENSSIGPYPEMGIYEIDSLSFGEPPDELDNDPRIYLLWFDFGIAADGYFFWFDEYPDGMYPEYHSNECEVLYLNTTSSGGPSGEYMLAVIAHEFEHMIHWKYDDNEAPWVDEGMAELAMWFYGNPDNISGFNTNPDNSLVVWDGTWADYIKTYLWSLYFFENYGGHPGAYAVVHESDNSIQGYEDVLDLLGYQEGFADVFADWTVANFLDDTSIEDGRFGYDGDELPPFGVSGTYSSYPAGGGYKQVNHWAADYYRFQDLTDFDNLLLTFDGDDGNGFAVWGLVLHDSSLTEVHRMTLEPSTQTGSVWLTGLSDPSDEVILVVGSASSAGGSGYYFWAEGVQGLTPDTGPGVGRLSLHASPNPFASTVALELEWSGGSVTAAPAAGIYDLNGRLVRVLQPDQAADGEASFLWDGRSASGELLPGGLYFARAGLEGATTGASLMLLP